MLLDHWTMSNDPGGEGAVNGYHGSLTASLSVVIAALLGAASPAAAQNWGCGSGNNNCSINSSGTLPAPTWATVTSPNENTLTYSVGTIGNVNIASPNPFWLSGPVIGLFGQGVTTTNYTETYPAFGGYGPSLTLTNNATITANNATLNAYGGIVAAISTGANGANNGDHNSTNATPNNGVAGGTVTVQHNGAIVINSGGSTYTTSNAAVAPMIAGVGAYSIGGNGGAYDTKNDCCGGSGGMGGTVSVTTGQNSSIALNWLGTAQAAGVEALSVGGLPANTTIVGAPFSGNAGAGGTVNAYHYGGITSNGGTNSAIGILAGSIGGTGSTASGISTMSGGGGAVNVTAYGGSSINLGSANGIGIFAVSAAGKTSYGYSSNTEAGGAVTVNVDQGAAISTTGGGLYSIGVLAVSSGTASVIEPFNAQANAGFTGGGYAGSVNVTNNGSITTAGGLAIGIAGLSIGGAAIVSSANSGYLGNSGSGYGSTGQGVTIANTGTITTSGSAAHGILASSTGGGGLLSISSLPGNGAALGSNTVVVGGNTQNDDGGHNGGAVAVTNAGTITTGGNPGSGLVAMGIVAQSIGGGGGSTGGNGAAFLVGDNGGSGGSGGTVSVKTTTGRINTSNDGAIGVLAHSIGGGGGNGANAAGIFVAVGGNGGSGGSGGGVTVDLGGGSAAGITTGGDFAMGVLAQSVGGGGGNGGYAKSAGLFFADSIGGSGGSGGSGGTVDVTNATAIATTGAQSAGIIAHSIGGGGGNGGAATAKSGGVIVSVSLAVGGKGGGGGDGDSVTVANNNKITTTGTDSAGILAQSIGGGGGNGGSALAKAWATSLGDAEPIDLSVTYSAGGSGGNGGTGGSVSVTNGGQIFTTADGGHGILAHSIGGGGGNAGDSTAGAHALENSPGSLKLAVALGGAGGSGQAGGNVTVANGPATGCAPPACFAQIGTTGNNAVGILAQSVGGGGGTSTMGQASTGSPNLGADTGRSVGVSFALGAPGGSGGTGGTVNVTQATANVIQTTGSGAQGILAQSIGGGGGAAGGGSAAGSEDSYDINVAVGGSGGSGNTGGSVTVQNAGTIATGQTRTITSNGRSFNYTTGGDASGILAQSIGGGGGYAGTTDASASISDLTQVENIVNIPSSASYAANIGVGGKGGSGGNGGEVQVGNSGTITTLGIRAYGIAAQSIGGGGGSGGAATSTDNGSTNRNYNASVLVGGTGGAAGDGGVVRVGNSGVIGTAGYGAHGILAQSIGGGGGVGGDGSMNAQSTLSLGATSTGNGGASGTGNAVQVQNDGKIQTVGDDAFGMLVQSIGGGGGAASAGCTNSVAPTNAAWITGVTTTASACLGNTSLSAGGNGPAAWAPGLSLSLNVGGNASAAGNGGDVTIIHNGNLVTTGARAFGITAQSIGGGGGIAVGAAVNIGGTNAASSPGSNYAKGGNVGITLGAGSSITTYGAGAYGILAQSIGGGGGFVGDSSLAMAAPQSNTLNDHANNNGYYPDSGTVTITTAGNIVTSGANAHGIFAQAIGGGGGVVSGCCGSATANLLAGNTAQFRGTSDSAITYAGEGMNVTISQTAGVISATGQGAIGIFAQSSGKNNYQQPIQVTVDGVVSGGTGAGAAGIMLSGGKAAGSGGSNTITVGTGGVVRTVDGINGMAIVTGSGLTALSNAGSITGSIDLGATPGNITNTGTLNTGSTIAANTLTSTGRIEVAGPLTIGTTSIGTATAYANLTQNQGGVLAIDIDSTAGQKADLINVTNNATIGGSIVPRPVALLPGTMTVLTAGNSLSSTATTPSAVAFDWNLSRSGNSLTLSPTANFTPGNVNLTAAEASVAAYLQKAWGNVDSAFATTFASLSQLSTAGGYAGILAQMSPQATQAQATVMARLASAGLGAPLSCPEFVNDGGTLLGEDSCAWARMGALRTTQGADSTGSSYRVDGMQYRLGAQRQIADNWFVSGALGFGQSWARIGNGGTGDGKTYEGSVALKYVNGRWLFAGSAAATTGSFHNNRYVGSSTLLQSDPKANLYGGRLRAAYTLPLGGWYLRPGADIDVVHLDARGFQEYGNGAATLNVRSSSKTTVAFTPRVEIGGRRDFEGGLILRPYISAGLSYTPDGDRNVEASLVGASAQTGTFSTTIGAPRVLGLLDIGLQVYRDKGFEVRAEYNLQANDNFVSQTGSLRAAWHF